MKSFTLRLTIVLLLCAGGMSLRAETITHKFNAMNSSGEISFNEDYTIGTTDFVTYTCTNCSIGANMGDPVAIQFKNSSSYVVISPALNNVKTLTIGYYPTDVNGRNIKVYVSEDGISWSSALDYATVKTGSIELLVPEGYYFIKIQNFKSTPVNISIIEYGFDACSDCHSYDY